MLPFHGRKFCRPTPRACLERTLDTFLEYTGPIRFILNQKILSVVWLQDVSLRLSLLS